MFKLFVYSLFVSCVCTYYYDESPFWGFQRQKKEPEPEPKPEPEPEQEPKLNLNASLFLSLKNYQVNGKSASEIDYPWIARVIHSRKYDKPHLCTAICIDKQIFITAARCVYKLKIIYTSLIYHDQRLAPKAFLISTNETKQMYDDIGFIIVTDDFAGTWKTVQPLDQKRTDSAFKWFGNMVFEDFEHIIIGYAQFKTDRSLLRWKRPYYLTLLEVNVDIKLCREILVYNQLIDAFAVPCYHSCTISQFVGKEAKTRHPKCLNYHGAEGSALINKKTKKLLGVATWGSYFGSYELPVGFAIPNSDNFYEDKACAVKIRNDDEFVPPAGYYQKLCDSKTIV